MPTILEARDLVKHYGATVAVDGVSFGAEAGTCFGLLGPNGAGKTTTVEIIEGILPATSGEVFYRGEPVGDRFRAEAGIQFQKTALQEFLTVRECLTLFRDLYPHGLKVDEAIRICALEKLADRDNRKLSGGQQQRLLLAIALINDPEVLFLDEPTTGLDPQARHALWDRLYRLKQRGVTLVLTTHYMDEAEQLCDRLVIMDRAKIVAEGSPRTLIERFVEREVVELRLGASDGAPALDGIGGHVEVLQDRIVIGTDDGDAVVDHVHARGLHPETVLVRRSTLEDVFLRLTGRTLVD